MSGTDGFTFRVSDVAFIQRRGMLLRLKRTAGEPSIKHLARGRRLRLSGPDGEDRTVSIVGHATTGGKPTQKRLDATGEVDVVIRVDEALENETPVAIGWEASGPVS